MKWYLKTSFNRSEFKTAFRPVNRFTMKLSVQNSDGESGGCTGQKDLPEQSEVPKWVATAELIEEQGPADWCTKSDADAS